MNKTLEQMLERVEKMRTALRANRPSTKYADGFTDPAAIAWYRGYSAALMQFNQFLDVIEADES